MCDAWPDIASCRGRVAECSLCHTSIDPYSATGAIGPAWTPFGARFFMTSSKEEACCGPGASPSSCEGAWVGNTPGDHVTWECYSDAFVSELHTTLEGLLADPFADIDGDCVHDHTELVLGTDPSDPEDAPWQPFVPPEPAGEPNPWYDVGAWDPAFAFRRVKTIYCGESATYAEQQAFAAADDPYAAVHAALDACLASVYWYARGLPRIGDELIRPARMISTDADAGAGFPALADYNYDFRLFAWVMSGDRDARQLLLADFHVLSVDGFTDLATSLTPVDGVIEAGAYGPWLRSRCRHRTAPVW